MRYISRGYRLLLKASLCDMKLRDHIAQNIINGRKCAGLSQEALAKRAGVSRAYIGRIENARHSLSIDTLGKIAVALDVDAVELLRPFTD